MRNKLFFSIILICLALSGCSHANENTAASRETAAQTVINTMLTGPNEDLCNESVFTAIGEGVDTAPKKTDTWTEMLQNWESRLGDYFVPDGLDTFIESGPANQFLSESCIKETSMCVENIELTQKEEWTEVYLVHWTIGDEERQDKIFFRYNSENLIEEVKIL